MNVAQNWFVPVLAACFVHGVVAVWPVHFKSAWKEAHESVMTFKLVSMPQVKQPTLAEPSPSLTKTPPPKPVSQKRIIEPPKSRSRPHFVARKPLKPQPLSSVHTKDIPAAIDMATVQSGQALPGQVSLGPVGVPASPGAPGNESAGTAAGPITLSADELSVYCPEMQGPTYPMISRQLGEQGKVVIELELNKNGRLGEVRVKQSSGYDRLDAGALDAVHSWRCNPPVFDGHPVLAVAQQPFDFILH